MGKENLYIQNAKIYLATAEIEKGGLFIRDGKIEHIFKDPTQFEIPENTKVIEGEKLNLIPGFIDTHIHGVLGVDVMDGTVNALEHMASQLPREGTTSFLATTMTQPREKIEQTLEAIGSYKGKEGEAEVLGIHLEGPFLHENQAGAQPTEYMMAPDVDLFRKWNKIAREKIVTVTYAPELDEDKSFLKFCLKKGLNVSAGHTDLTFRGMKTAISDGIHQLTHLCNCMTGIHHRDIGAVGAAFLDERVKAEVIADGLHISQEMLQIIYDFLGPERILLVTDSIRAKGLPEGEYDLGGQTVEVKGNEARLSTGQLAGSVLTMDEAARQMLSLKNVTFKNVIQMASENPAKQIGVFDRKGSIALHKDADLLLVDDDFQIKYTICRGAIAFEGD